MVDILNLAIPYFGLIFIGFACGKVKELPEQGLAWMNFFLLDVSLPALLFGIMSKSPFEELTTRHCWLRPPSERPSPSPHPPVAIDNTLSFLQNAAAPAASDPSAGRVWTDVVAGAVPATLGGRRRPDGVAAAGAERVCHRPPK
jgi:hypothetical protein